MSAMNPNLEKLLGVLGAAAGGYTGDQNAVRGGVNLARQGNMAGRIPYGVPQNAPAGSPAPPALPTTNPAPPPSSPVFFSGQNPLAGQNINRGPGGALGAALAPAAPSNPFSFRPGSM